MKTTRSLFELCSLLILFFVTVAHTISNTLSFNNTSLNNVTLNIDDNVNLTPLNDPTYYNKTSDMFYFYNKSLEHANSSEFREAINAVKFLYFNKEGKVDVVSHLYDSNKPNYK